MITPDIRRMCIGKLNAGKDDGNIDIYLIILSVVHISNYINSACNNDIDCNSSLLRMLISSTDCWEPASTTVLLLL